MGPDDNDLYSVIEAHNQQTIRLFVYNCDTDKCREVSYCIAGDRVYILSNQT